MRWALLPQAQILSPALNVRQVSSELCVKVVLVILCIEELENSGSEGEISLTVKGSCTLFCRCKTWQ